MSDLLQNIVAIAQKAGTSIMKLYTSNALDSTHKSDNSPLTKADIASHNIIVKELGLLNQGYPIISEEDGTKEYNKASTFWLVDPLDGTKEFINKNGEFTVNIGLIHNGYPVMGVVYAPAIAVAYVGEHQKGAFKIYTDKQIKIKSIYTQDIVNIVASRSHRDENTEVFLKKIGQHKLISMGSSLKLCLIAEGGAMLYPRFAPTYGWDTAAADAVVRAGGGKVQDLNGADLVYVPYRKKNPFFMAATSNALDWQTTVRQLHIKP